MNWISRALRDDVGDRDGTGEGVRRVNGLRPIRYSLQTGVGYNITTLAIRCRIPKDRHEGQRPG